MSPLASKRDQALQGLDLGGLHRSAHGVAIDLLAARRHPLDRVDQTSAPVIKEVMV